MLLMQEEHAKELRSIREETNATIHDAIRNNAAMDTKHPEDKQSLQMHFAALSRNAREEKQIAIARLSAKLQVRDKPNLRTSRISRQVPPDDERNPIPQRPPEPMIPPVAQNSEILPVGLHPAGTNKFERPPNPNDPDPLASDGGPLEGRRRWGGPPGGSDPDPQEPPGRVPDRIPDSKKSKASNITLLRCHLRQDFTNGDRRLRRDAVTASYEYNPDAAHNWIIAVEKPTATFDLMRSVSHTSQHLVLN